MLLANLRAVHFEELDLSKTCLPKCRFVRTRVNYDGSELNLRSKIFQRLLTY